MKIQEIAGNTSRDIPPSFMCTERITDCNGNAIDFESKCSQSMEEAIKVCCKMAIEARRVIAARKLIN